MGLWEAVSDLKSNPEVYRLVNAYITALSPVPSLTLPLLGTRTVRFKRDVDSRRQWGVFQGHRGRQAIVSIHDELHHIAGIFAQLPNSRLGNQLAQLLIDRQGCACNSKYRLDVRCGESLGYLTHRRVVKLCTVDVEAIAVQVAAPITGHENATQFPIPSCVECVI